MARKLNNEHLRNMAESVADVPDGRMLNNDYLRIIAENFSGGGGGGGTGTVDASSIVGVIPAENLPSYVDDVLEYSSESALPATGETGKIYVTTDTNTTYRWSGSAYVPISNPLDYATQAEAETGAENTHVMTALRTKQAIDANAYELPLMSESTRGGAKLGHGLTVEDGALGIGSVTDATDAGPIVALSAKGWAEQDTTVGKNLLNLTRQVDGTSVYAMNVSDASVNNQVLSLTANGSNPYLGRVASAGDSYASNCGTLIPVEPNTTYFLSWTNSAFNQMYYTEYDESKVSLGFSYRTSAGTITTKADTRYLTMRIGISNATSGTTYSTAVQLELGSTATSYEPYTGGAPSPSPSYPQEIRRVTGRNLLPNTATSQTINGVTFTKNADCTVTVNGTATATTNYFIALKSAFTLVAGQAYTLTGTPSGGSNSTYLMTVTDDVIATYRDHGSGVTFTPTEALVANNYRIRIGIISGYTANNLVFKPQLERGSIAHPYVPYGCVGVDVTHDGTTTTIPIPLPSRGWVAALPDGTADTLTLDGAGGYVWELKTEMLDLSGITWTLDTSVGVSNMFMSSRQSQALLQSSLLCTHYKGVQKGASSVLDGEISATGTQNYMFFRLVDSRYSDAESFNAAVQGELLYKLVTPTTESGYVNSMPTVPIHAAISSADLVDLAVRCCADSGAAEIASAWGRRYESRIAALEDAVATLVAAGA